MKTKKYRDRIIKRYQIKNDAFKEKYLKYTKEKRLAEDFYIIKKDRLLVKNLIKSFIRDSFYEKKKQTKERLVFSFEKWKNQFFFFEEKKTKSKVIRDELSWIRKKQEVNLLFLKHYFFKSLLVESGLEIRLVSGIVEKLKKKESINSIIILNHKIGRKERIKHKSFCYSLNLLGILPGLIWKYKEKENLEEEKENTEIRKMEEKNENNEIKRKEEENENNEIKRKEEENENNKVNKMNMNKI
jgi:hypothetical protein